MWNEELTRCIRTLEELYSRFPHCEPSGAGRRKRVEAAHQAYPVKITPFSFHLMKPGAPDDPVMKQLVPSPEENYATGSGRRDPLEESKHTPVPGVIHKYPDVQRVYVVFDGDSTVGPFQSESRNKIRVVYSASHEEADERILKIIRENTMKASYTLVTNDTELIRRASAFEAPSQSPELFLHASQPKIRSKKQKSGKIQCEPVLTPGEEKEITEELLTLWCREEDHGTGQDG